MIEGNQYVETVKMYFGFLVSEFGFKIAEEKIRGNAFYDVQYKDETRIVSISYENIEDYLLVIIYLLQNGQLPDYDDESKTLHLNKLNSRVMSRISRDEIDLNNERFLEFDAKDGLKKKLLKAAKELRLYLIHSNELK